MDTVPTSSGSYSPPKKRKRLDLGHLSIAEKQCILNMYKQLRANATDLRKTAIISKISNTVGDKPHACDLCNKKFALACNLRAHMKTHEGDPQEECTRCGKMYLCSGSPDVCPNCRNQNQPTDSAEDSSGNHTEDSNEVAE